jgi:hypothetical protein
MNAPNDNAGRRSFREWWRNPPRSGLQRIINPWEYRHLGFCAAARIVGGTVAAAAGIICLAYSAWGWAAFFLVIAALNYGGGAWYLSIVRSRTAQASA